MILWILFAILVACPVSLRATDLGAAVPPEEVRDLVYGAFKLPSVVGPSRVEKLLRLVADEIHGVGFRYLGVDEDWFHGHLLFEERDLQGQKRLFPRAVLYHTQEQAYAAHWEEGRVDPKYDYLEVTTRNWLQWLDADAAQDGMRVVNAREYLDTTQKDPAPFFNEGAAPEAGQHYTIHARNLDLDKLGFQIHGELQFEFYVTSCTTPEVDPWYERGPIEVSLNGNPVCLKLRTQTQLIHHPWGA